MPSSGVQTCARSEEHTSELQSHDNLVCRLLLEKKIYRPRPRAIRAHRCVCPSPPPPPPRRPASRDRPPRRPPAPAVVPVPPFFFLKARPPPVFPHFPPPALVHP